MATIRKSKVGKYTYWQIVESKRVNGKPRPFVIAHLGTAEQLMYKLSGGAYKKKIKSYTHGACSVLWKIVEDFGMIEIFENIFSSQKREGISVGKSLILGAIHRIISPGSKSEFASFAKQTTLPILADFDAEKLDSQFFWDQMNTVSDEQIEKAEDALTRKLLEKKFLSPNLLFYDMTNFYTYISTENEKASIVKRGKNKQKRNDLRQFGLSQVVTKEFLIPVFTKVYQGNQNDSTRFIPFLTDFRKKITELSFDMQQLTIVFDKGSNTKKNFEELDAMELPYVASATSSYHEDLIRIPFEKYREVLIREKKIKCYRTSKEIWGKERVVVIYLSQELKNGQVRGLMESLKKKKDRLLELNEKLKAPKARKRKIEDLRKEIDGIIKGEKIETILQCMITEKSEGKYELTWQENDEEIKRLTDEVYGKKILITCRKDWSDEEIISAYFGQSSVEHVFRQLKNPYHNSVCPQFHWTDQKIKVHTFMCVVGLLLTQLVLKISSDAGFSYSSNKILEILSEVRQTEIMTIRDLKGKPESEILLEEMENYVDELFTKLMEAAI